MATSAAAKLVFNESAKVNTQVTGANLLMGLPKQVVNLQYMHLVFAKDSVNTDDIIVHLKADANSAYTPQTEALIHRMLNLVLIHKALIPRMLNL